MSCQDIVAVPSCLIDGCLNIDYIYEFAKDIINFVEFGICTPMEIEDEQPEITIVIFFELN